VFFGGEKFRDSEVLAHLEREGGSRELELENVTVVIDMLFSNDFELCLDWLSELSGKLFWIG
jgi:hypothetical protein